MTEQTILSRIVRAMRNADDTFVEAGEGNTTDYVQDHLLGFLDEVGLAVVDVNEHRVQRIRDIVGVQWLEMCGVIWRFMRARPWDLVDGGASPQVVDFYTRDAGEFTPLPLRERHRSAEDIVDGRAP